MKRIVCIGIVLATLLIASNAFCGTDDSGLQVFTLNGADMMGETADVGQEDTKIAQYSLNMFQSGNGLCSYGRSSGNPVEFDGTPEKITTSTYTFVKISNAGGASSSEVYVHFNPLSAFGTRTRLLANVFFSSQYDLFSFSGLNKDYLFAGNKYIYSTNGWSTTTEVTLPSSGGTHCALWQNRFWYSNGYTIYYTAAQDFENFINSATAGGTTNILGITSINKFAATRLGLYIFTDKGIFLQSGPSKAWTIEKISDLRLSNVGNVTVYNDVVFFATYKKLWQMSAYNITLLADIPSEYETLAYTNLGIYLTGKFLILASEFGTTSFVFDLKTKTFSRNLDFNLIGEKDIYAKKTSTGKYKIFGAPQPEQFVNEQDIWTATNFTPSAWSYKTAWMTLDGNAGNRKEIDRIEMDYQGGTSTVYLYYAFGTGTVADAATYYNPSTGFGFSMIAPTNTRFNTQVWNLPMGKTQTNRLWLQFSSNGTQTMTTNHIIKQIRIYYRNIGNYKTNTLR